MNCVGIGVSRSVNRCRQATGFQQLENHYRVIKGVGQHSRFTFQRFMLPGSGSPCVEALLKLFTVVYPKICIHQLRFRDIARSRTHLRFQIGRGLSSGRRQSFVYRSLSELKWITAQDSTSVRADSDSTISPSSAMKLCWLKAL